MKKRYFGCSIDGCNGNHKGRGFCSKHYHRWERHGDPLGGGTEVRAPLKWLKDHSSYQGDECLAWPFGTDGHGVGIITVSGAKTKASRAMCYIVNGDPPDPSYQAAHSCGNGHLGCVTPKHLRWATTSENQMDRVIHGTSNRGSRNPQSILTEEQVKSIKTRLLSGELGKDLATAYGVSKMTISSIKNGKRWKWMKPFTCDGAA